MSWEVWLVYEPWKLALVVAPFFLLYFYGVHRLEKWLKKREANRVKSPGFYTPMDIAPGEYAKEFE